jgi:predicted Rossmann-fold nucleotide-binding protein
VVVLVGTGYWGGLIEWLRTRVLTEGKVAEKDLALFELTDDPVEAVRLVVEANEKHEAQRHDVETDAVRATASARRRADRSGGPGAGRRKH